MERIEVVILLSWVILIGISLFKHGEEKEGKYNVYVTLISVVISYFIYRWCGLF